MGFPAGSGEGWKRDVKAFGQEHFEKEIALPRTVMEPKILSQSLGFFT